MTRIIAGAAGSLPLVVPDAGTRPTSDRVRESLFASLDAAGLVEGSAVLDLFAGSGALGLEALSRGAASADLVEKSPRAAAVVDRNVQSVRRALPAATVHVHRQAADAFLRACSRSFDLVFVDPPYDVGETELSTTLALLAPHLSAGAVVVVERAARSPEPAAPAPLVHERSKRYGDTILWWLFVA